MTFEQETKEISAILRENSFIFPSGILTNAAERLDAQAGLIEQQAKRIAELERLNLSFAQNEQMLSQCHTLMAESVIATYAKDGLYRVTIGVENSEKMHSILNVLDSIAATDTQ